MPGSISCNDGTFNRCNCDQRGEPKSWLYWGMAKCGVAMLGSVEVRVQHGLCVWGSGPHRTPSFSKALHPLESTAALHLG